MTPLQSSNWQKIAPKNTAKRNGWRLGASITALLSIGGGVLVNLWLNPPTQNSNLSANANAKASSDLVQYRYGEVQLEAVTEAGKLTQVNLLTATASPGYEPAFQMLQEAALAAQGTDFQNISGAKFSSKAFKEALANAIGKIK